MKLVLIGILLPLFAFAKLETLSVDLTDFDLTWKDQGEMGSLFAPYVNYNGTHFQFLIDRERGGLEAKLRMKKDIILLESEKIDFGLNKKYIQELEIMKYLRGHKLRLGILPENIFVNSQELKTRFGLGDYRFENLRMDCQRNLEGKFLGLDLILTSCFNNSKMDMGSIVLNDPNVNMEIVDVGSVVSESKMQIDAETIIFSQEGSRVLVEKPLIACAKKTYRMNTKSNNVLFNCLRDFILEAKMIKLNEPVSFTIQEEQGLVPYEIKKISSIKIEIKQDEFVIQGWLRTLIPVKIRSAGKISVNEKSNLIQIWFKKGWIGGFIPAKRIFMRILKDIFNSSEVKIEKNYVEINLGKLSGL